MLALTDSQLAHLAHRRDSRRSSNRYRQRAEQPNKHEPLQQNGEHKQKAQDEQQYQPR
jgi:hypothetical protein